VSSDAERAVAAPDAESAQVAEWLARHGRAMSAVEPLAGDVSTRRYYRVRLAGETTSHIVARYPPELAAAQRRFAAAAELLAAAGVRVPAIRLDDPDAGFACVEDLGPATLHERFATWEAAAGELDAALAAADAIRRLDRERVVALGSPPLDAALLRRELAQTVELLLAPRDLAPPAVERALDALCDELAAPPLVPCHRDFMARNLVPVAPAGVAVLDFQDLRLGPQGYDLASLLNDSLFASDEVEARALGAWPRLAGGPETYRLAVAQRSLKAVGTYLAFARRGKRRHLPLVEPTLERALRQLARLRCTTALGDALWTRIRAAGRDAALC
jgi:aminoglycoside/choline kinase family phosphotransferase